MYATGRHTAPGGAAHVCAVFGAVHRGPRVRRPRRRQDLREFGAKGADEPLRSGKCPGAIGKLKADIRKQKEFITFLDFPATILWGSKCKGAKSVQVSGRVIFLSHYILFDRCIWTNRSNSPMHQMHWLPEIVLPR